MTRETDQLLLLRRVRARCESLPTTAIGACGRGLHEHATSAGMPLRRSEHACATGMLMRGQRA